MNILSLDASFSLCSAAIEANGLVVVRTQAQPRTHSQHILSMIDECFSEANISLSDIDVCAFAKGPGSFTGLRLIAAIVQGFSFAHHWKIIPISSLQALAQAAYLERGFDNVIVCEDARIKQVYWSHLSLQNQIMLPVVDDQCTQPHLLLDHLRSLAKDHKTILVGSGWQAYPEFENFCDLRNVISSEALCMAKGLLSLAHYFSQQNKTVKVRDAIPNYVQPLQYQKPV